MEHVVEMGSGDKSAKILLYVKCYLYYKNILGVFS